MPRRSTVLDSPHRATIDGLIGADRPLRGVAAEFGLSYHALWRYAQRIRAKSPIDSQTGPFSAVATFERAFGFAAMEHQRVYLEETRPTIVQKGRQVGMTSAASALAVYTARSLPGSTSVIISPSLRQSSEVTARARLALWELGERLKQDSVSLLRTASGSRIISLPGSARGIRGYACQLVVVDEAAFVSDEIWAAARPLVSATNGRLIVQSTPGHPSGFFYELATDTPDGWAFMKVRSDEVSTISADFLAKERREMSPDLYAQEYEAEFGTGGGGVFFKLERLRELTDPAHEGDGNGWH
jgi:hypothetical protein